MAAAGPQDSSSTTNSSSTTSSTSSIEPQKPKRPINDQKNAPANIVPQSAGADISFFDLLRSVKLDEFWTIHRQPCVRDALLAGITGGFLVGGGRAALGGTIWSTLFYVHQADVYTSNATAPIPRAANWAVGAMIGTSVGAYEYCQYRRRKEIEGMRRVVEIIERKRAEKERKLKEAADAKNKAEQEQQQRIADEKRRQSRWWKIW